MLRRHRPRPAPSSAAGPHGAVLGRRLAGERALPVGPEGSLVWPFEDMCRHAVILGASGTGKTETSMRIAHEVAVRTEMPVFYLDAKGDRQNAERFCALMAASGRSARVFPNEPFDGWRGDWRAISNRLLEVIEFATEGAAAYYRDVAKTALRLACNHPAGPPRSSAELLGRLDYEALLNAHGPSMAVLALPRERVSQVRLRYEAFFGQLGASLDGEWSWEDADAAYLLLDSVALGEDTASAACLLFADFAHYFAKRKDRARRCLLFVDEFSSLAMASDVAAKVEQARGFGAGMVLVPQTPSGMGFRGQRDRILGSVETLVVHASPAAEEIAGFAGAKRVPELTRHFDEATGARERFASRPVERPRLEPDAIRRLPTGTAWVIRRGRSAKVAIAPAPALAPVPLPPSAALDPPLEPLPMAAPVTPSYLDDEED